MLSSTVPSEWARNLVRGAYDLHVHVAPDVMRRRVTDVQLARRCWDAGLAGFVLKSHYVPTAERAAVVNEALGGEVQVLGALALNASVGGMNPLAVEIAAREGARILWMPTVDAANHRAFGRDFAPGAQPPPWLALQQDLDSRGITVDPVAVVDDAGRAAPGDQGGARAGRAPPAGGGHRPPQRVRDAGHRRRRPGGRGPPCHRHPS